MRLPVFASLVMSASAILRNPTESSAMNPINGSANRRLSYDTDSIIETNQNLTLGKNTSAYPDYWNENLQYSALNATTGLVVDHQNKMSLDVKYVDNQTYLVFPPNDDDEYREQFAFTFGQCSDTCFTQTSELKIKNNGNSSIYVQINFVDKSNQQCGSSGSDYERESFEIKPGVVLKLRFPKLFKEDKQFASVEFQVSDKFLVADQNGVLFKNEGNGTIMPVSILDQISNLAYGVNVTNVDLLINQLSCYTELQPSAEPTMIYSTEVPVPTKAPIPAPSPEPVGNPTELPTGAPSTTPTMGPSAVPSLNPTGTPTGDPTVSPTGDPTVSPTGDPTVSPTGDPTVSPTGDPTVSPTGDPTVSPTGDPTVSPTGDPTVSPTGDPTVSPTGDPTVSPTGDPTVSPTGDPTVSPTGDPTVSPTGDPTVR